MATPQTDERMTAEAFWEAYQDRPGPDYELWDGVVVEGEVTGYRHQRILFWLTTMLDRWVAMRGGHTWMDGGVKFGPHDVRGPDLMVWWSGQPVDPVKLFDAIPDLVIEIISPQPRDVRRDREEKLADYCAHGIPRYWIVEPIHRTFERYVRTRVGKEWEYRRVGLDTAGTIRVPELRGLTLDLDALWRSIKDWTD